MTKYIKVWGLVNLLACILFVFVSSEQSDEDGKKKCLQDKKKISPRISSLSSPVNRPGNAYL